jgi:L-cystine transport system permease protein
VERPFSPAYIIEVLPRLLAFLPVTLFLMAAVITLGLLAGFLLARARIAGGPARRAASQAYTLAMRCTPSVVMLFLVYYALPEIAWFLFGVDINSIYKGVFVIITMTLLFAATMGEVMRSAYLAIDKGQREAALSAGLSEAQAFFRIVCPQAIVVALPNFGNAIINLMKEGALAYTIGMIDMMGRGTLIISNNYGAYGLETYLALAVVYWALTLAIEKSFLLVEKKLSKGSRSLAAASSKAPA